MIKSNSMRECGNPATTYAGDVAVHGEAEGCETGEDRTFRHRRLGAGRRIWGSVSHRSELMYAVDKSGTSGLSINMYFHVLMVYLRYRGGLLRSRTAAGFPGFPTAASTPGLYLLAPEPTSRRPLHDSVSILPQTLPGSGKPASMTTAPSRTLSAVTICGSFSTTSISPRLAASSIHQLGDISTRRPGPAATRLTAESDHGIPIRTHVYPLLHIFSNSIQLKHTASAEPFDSGLVKGMKTIHILPTSMKPTPFPVTFRDREAAAAPVYRSLFILIQLLNMFN